jgi:hypothetical protein
VASTEPNPKHHVRPTTVWVSGFSDNPPQNFRQETDAPIIILISSNQVRIPRTSSVFLS